MAASEALAIEPIGAGDVASGLALSDAAGWNQTAADWAFFIAEGNAIGVRDDAGRLVASAAALPYDGAVGWIAMVLVDADHRHRGWASRLVAACVETLTRSGRAPLLDATPAGAEVYRRSGFVAGFAFERWEGGAATIAAIETESGIAAGPSKSDTLIDLDRSACGVDRALLLRSFLARAATRAWFAPRGDGFALRRAGRRAVQVGPIVATDDAAAVELLALALAGIDGRVFIDVPVHRTSITEALTRRGFVRQRPFVRMALGDPHAAAARERVFALAGPEFG